MIIILKSEFKTDKMAIIVILKKMSKQKKKPRNDSKFEIRKENWSNINQKSKLIKSDETDQNWFWIVILKVETEKTVIIKR